MATRLDNIHDEPIRVTCFHCDSYGDENCMSAKKRGVCSVDSITNTPGINENDTAFNFGQATLFGIPMVQDDWTANEGTITITRLGWQCPMCDVGVSPDEKICPECAQNKHEEQSQ